MKQSINNVEFSKVNVKLEKNIDKKTSLYNKTFNQDVKKLKIYSFSLPAGYSCPFASECLSKADKVTGKIKDGPKTQFRCFEASMESAYKNLRLKNWRNFDTLKNLSSSEMYQTINNSIPKDTNVIRIHVGGDFFNKSYVLAWLQVAIKNPSILFYAYTKSASYFLGLNLPENFNITFSLGGKNDNLVLDNNLKYSKVVYSEKESKDLSLTIDKDDSLAMFSNKSFALLIHGTQPKGSEASQKLQVILKEKRRLKEILKKVA